MRRESAKSRHELMKGVTIHTHACGEGGILVNAYLVETPSGVVVIDSTLSETEGKAFRKELEALEKPLLAVLVTHPIWSAIAPRTRDSSLADNSRYVNFDAACS